jgi:starch-binding outer membrane protein, SusD/RagB family
MKKTTIVLLLFCLGLFSCKDNFFENPRPQEQPWTSTLTLDQLVTECYRLILWEGRTRGNFAAFDYMMSGCSQTADVSDNLFDDCQTIWYERRFSDNTTSQMGDLWGTLYTAVYGTNAGIAFDKENNSNPFELDLSSEDYIQNYKRQIGELYFIRAYAYYFLARVWCHPYNDTNKDKLDIVFTTEPQSSTSDLKQGTVGQVYDQIVQDLKTAIDLLPEAITGYGWSATSIYNCGRVNKYAAKSLLAKIYFVMGQYSDAEKLLDDVISSGVYTLEEVYKPFISNERSYKPSESIWEFNTGDPSGKRDWTRELNYAAVGFNYRHFNGADHFGNFLYDPETKLPLTTMTALDWNSCSLSYYILRQAGWMEPDKGHTYPRPYNDDPISSDTAFTADAKADLRFTQLLHVTKGACYGFPEGDSRNKSIVKPAILSGGAPDLSDGKTLEEFYAQMREYLEYEPDAAEQRRTCGTRQVYVDKFFRGPDNGYGTGAAMTKWPLIRLGELILIKAWILQNDGDKAQAAVELNKLWNRANPTNPDRYNASNTDHTAVYQEFIKEMLGEGGIYEFQLATHMTIPKGDNPFSTVSDISYPYETLVFAIPESETSLNSNF